MTNREVLRGVSNYPVPRTAIESIAARNQIVLDEEASWSDDLTRCEIGVLEFLMTAPKVTQDGISYSLTDEDKKLLARRAKRLRHQIGEDDPDEFDELQLGYQGELL